MLFCLLAPLANTVIFPYSLLTLAASFIVIPIFINSIGFICAGDFSHGGFIHSANLTQSKNTFISSLSSGAKSKNSLLALSLSRHKYSFFPFISNP
jgi:hypothetical protein